MLLSKPDREEASRDIDVRFDFDKEVTVLLLHPASES
jgi:hypothetical protein